MQKIIGVYVIKNVDSGVYLVKIWGNHAYKISGIYVIKERLVDLVVLHTKTSGASTIKKTLPED